MLINTTKLTNQAKNILKFHKKLNKKRPAQFSEINVKNFEVSNSPPVLKNFRLITCCDKTDELVFDFDLTYKGRIGIILGTVYKPNGLIISNLSPKKEFDIDLSIVISELVSVMRVSITPYSKAKPWLIN